MHSVRIIFSILISIFTEHLNLQFHIIFVFVYILICNFTNAGKQIKFCFSISSINFHSLFVQFYQLVYLIHTWDWDKHQTNRLLSDTILISFLICVSISYFCKISHQIELANTVSLARGGGALNFGLRTMCHQKDPTFFSLAFTERLPFLPTFTQWPPIFRKFWHFWRNVEKFLAILALKAPIFDAYHWKTPYFCALCHSKTPLFWRNLSPKDPYIWVAWWHSYVTFICECPPRHCI